MAELWRNAAFMDRQNGLSSADTVSDARQSREMQVALCAECAGTHSRMLEIPHIMLHTDMFGMGGNSYPPPPPSDETCAPHVGGCPSLLGGVVF